MSLKNHNKIAIYLFIAGALIACIAKYIEVFYG